MSKMFFGGQPTAYEVRKLEEAFPALKEEDEVTHDQIEAVIKVTRRTNRYRNVVSAWRKKTLREKNIDLGSVHAVGYRCLLPPERVGAGIKGVQSGVRLQLKSINRACLAETEDRVLRSKQEVMRRYGVALSHEASTLMKEIALPKAPEQLPRLKP